MSPEQPRAAVGCSDPALGVEVHRHLGRELPPTLREHVERCLACRLERINFARFEQTPAPR